MSTAGARRSARGEACRRAAQMVCICLGPWVGHSQHSQGWDTANTAKKTSDDALAVWPLLLTEGQHVCVVFEDTEGLRHSPHNPELTTRTHHPSSSPSGIEHPGGSEGGERGRRWVEVGVFHGQRVQVGHELEGREGAHGLAEGGRAGGALGGVRRGRRRVGGRRTG